jgi:hypothetical protein
MTNHKPATAQEQAEFSAVAKLVAGIMHRPVTALPWSFSGRNGRINSLNNYVADLNQRSGAEQDGSYIAHAANAYLKLAAKGVWFLEFCAEHPEWTEEQFPEDTAEREWLDDYRALLRELGELK